MTFNMAKQGMIGKIDFFFSFSPKKSKGGTQKQQNTVKTVTIHECIKMNKKYHNDVEESIERLC